MDRLSWCLEQLSPPGYDAALSAARVILESKATLAAVVSCRGRC